MTVLQWSKELGCNPETLRRAIRLRQLPAQRRPFGQGRPWLISARDMAHFIEKRRFQ